MASMESKVHRLGGEVHGLRFEDGAAHRAEERRMAAGNAPREQRHCNFMFERRLGNVARRRQIGDEMIQGGGRVDVILR